MLPSPPENPRASIVIRTFNEAKHLPTVLRRLSRQTEQSFEVVLVDSGSTDQTVAIAELANARIVNIPKSQFTFGRSLNIGCREAKGEFLVFLSGHCYPINRGWLEQMLAPFSDQGIGLVYGMQRGWKTSKYSETRHFKKTFPERSAIPQEGFFCNNANCAIRKSLWLKHPYDETLTGLEDLHWAKWLVTSAGGKTAYAAKGGVYHIHEETWQQVFRRYEREAIALKHIMPELRFSLVDFLRLFVHSTLLDMKAAGRWGLNNNRLREILTFRFLQYWATYRGVHFHRALTQQIKEKFFFPNK